MLHTCVTCCYRVVELLQCSKPIKMELNAIFITLSQLYIQDYGNYIPRIPSIHWHKFRQVLAWKASTFYTPF